VPSSKEIAVLVACERVIRTWPVVARIAFREAVLRDVRDFLPGDWDLGAALAAAEIFGSRWARGLPWPPAPGELEVAAPATPAIDLEAIEALARRIRAIGIELALVSAPAR
jgi:hypothetical protein